MACLKLTMPNKPGLSLVNETKTVRELNSETSIASDSKAKVSVAELES
jgi:hypothetical protein